MQKKSCDTVLCDFILYVTTGFQMDVFWAVFGGLYTVVPTAL